MDKYNGQQKPKMESDLLLMSFIFKSKNSQTSINSDVWVTAWKKKRRIQEPILCECKSSDSIQCLCSLKECACASKTSLELKVADYF